MSKIVILGDLFPKNVSNFPKIAENDFCVANLECAITDSDKPIKKDGPNLKINRKEAEIIKSLGVNLVGLANNHVMDYGLIGLSDTLSYLDSKNIKHAGSRSDCNFYIASIGDKKVCFYFVSEHQYNSFNGGDVGVNVLEPDKVFQEISLLKSKSDFLIVCFHGGKEYYSYPTPSQQSTCRKFVDSGVDFVVCQHSHCVGCMEIYNSAHIVYGQGNFAFPYSENEQFKTGIIIEISLDSSCKASISFTPIVHKEKDTIRYANQEEKDRIIECFKCSSSVLKDKTAEVLYDDMVSKFGLDFLYRLFNKSSFYIRLDTSRLFKNRMMKRYLKKNQKYILYLYNYFNCETHVEYIKTILSKQIKDEVK